MKFSTKLFPIVFLISIPATKLFCMENLTASTMTVTSIEKTKKQLLILTAKLEKLNAELFASDTTSPYWTAIADDFETILNKAVTTEEERVMNKQTARLQIKNAARIKLAANKIINERIEKKLFTLQEIDAQTKKKLTKKEENRVYRAGLQAGLARLIKEEILVPAVTEAQAKASSETSVASSWSLFSIFSSSSK